MASPPIAALAQLGVETTVSPGLSEKPHVCFIYKVGIPSWVTRAVVPMLVTNIYLVGDTTSISQIECQVLLALLQ